MFVKRGSLKDLYPLIFIVCFIAFSSLYFFAEPELTGQAVADCSDADGDGYYDSSCSECSGEVQLTSDDTIQRIPMIFGEKVYFEDNRNGNWEIYQYDLSSGVETRLTTNSLVDFGVMAYATDFVFVRRDGDLEIMKGSIPITNDEFSQSSPDVDSGWIVWQDDRNGNFDIYGDRRGTVSAIVNTAANEKSPRLDGIRMVYEVEGDIWLKRNIEDANPGIKLSGQGVQRFADISGNYIVWQTNVNSNWDIVLYSISEGSSTVITADGSDHRNPRIQDDIVVWYDNRNGNWDIYAYDISSSTEVQVTSDVNDQVIPVVYDGKIVWEDARNGAGDIYYSEYGCEAVSDCNDADATISPVATEACDSVDNNCDGVIDEGCTSECAIDSDCVTLYGTGYACSSGTCGYSVDCLVSDSVYWLDTSGYEAETVGDGESLYAYVEGDGTCAGTLVSFDIYTYDGVDYTYVETGTMEALYDADYGSDMAYYTVTVSWPSEDTYYAFDASAGGTVLQSDLLKVCSDSTCGGTSTDDTATDDTTTDDTTTDDTSGGTYYAGCMYDGIEYNGWVDSTMTDYVNAVVEGDTVYMFSFGDGTCTDATHYVYDAVCDETSCVTGSLVDTVTGIVEYDAESAVDYLYAEWTATGTDAYYYFVTQSGEGAVYSDLLLVCSESCESTSFAATDAEDYAALYSTVDSSTDSTGEDTSSGDDTTSGDDTSSSGCEDLWDCTGVEWDDCQDGYSYRDISLCVYPDDEECQAEEYWPEYELECTSDGEVVDTMETAEVPIFSWLNVLVVVGLLVGFYYRKVKKS
ncbi:hypothetical protein HOC80_02250 [archaeon]|nr:hypothetical protein [archaeon]MBT4416901.1 hypothetical protein [archaeon]